MTSQPVLLLTRPDALSERVAEVVRNVLPEVQIVVSPVMKIEAANAVPALDGYDAVIVTSQSAGRFLPDLSGMKCYVVGAKTSEAVQSKNGEVAAMFETAKDLLDGPLVARKALHVRGEYAQGDIAENLNLAGIETDEAIVYRQTPAVLSEQAHQLLESEAPVVLPLYSPRSARLLAEQLDQIGPNLRAIAMSRTVADVWREKTGQNAVVLDAPTSENMHEQILALLRP